MSDQMERDLRVLMGLIVDSSHDLQDENERLKTENVKLRELVRGLNYCCSSRRKFVSCERCPLYDVTDVNIEPKCDLMMRELGIEAEE